MLAIISDLPSHIDLGGLNVLMELESSEIMAGIKDS